MVGGGGKWGLEGRGNKNTQGMEEDVACVCQGVTASVSQGSVRERGKAKRVAWRVDGEVRGEASLGEEKSEYVCWGLGGCGSWHGVEVSTARTQEAIKQSSKTELSDGKWEGSPRCHLLPRPFFPGAEGTASADCLQLVGHWGVHSSPRPIHSAGG